VRTRLWSTKFAGFAGLVALLVVAAPTATEPPQDGVPQPPTFKSGVEYVEVDVVVTNRQGQFVSDLTKNDFQVSEDGKRQTVTVEARARLGREETASRQVPITVTAAEQK
jgi:hypothetical protein